MTQSRSIHKRLPGRSSRRGATLFELLVALLLFDMSLLSLASVSGMAARRVGDAGRRNRAALAAASRVELLTAMRCGAGGSGTAVLERGVTEYWASQPVQGGQDILDSVRIESVTGESLVLRTRRPC